MKRRSIALSDEMLEVIQTLMKKEKRSEAECIRGLISAGIQSKKGKMFSEIERKFHKILVEILYVSKSTYLTLKGKTEERKRQMLNACKEKASSEVDRLLGDQSLFRDFL